MSTPIEIKDSAYAKLLAKSLPRPIHTAAEHARLTGILLKLTAAEQTASRNRSLLLTKVAFGCIVITDAAIPQSRPLIVPTISRSVLVSLAKPVISL